MSKRGKYSFFTLLLALCVSISQPSQALTSGDLELLRQAATKLQGEYARIQKVANDSVLASGGAADCDSSVRQAREKATEYALLARLSNDIYQRQEGSQLKLEAVAEKDYRDANGRLVTSYRDIHSEGYAELHHERLPNVRILVFRGTKISSLKDITTNLVQFSNVLPARYRWADDLVARLQRQFPDTQLVLAGHSLGGGVAMYAGLLHQLPAVTFNPAGLSRGVVAELRLSSSQWQARGKQITAFISRSGQSVDPVSATSLAGRTVMAGRRYIVNLESGLSPLQQHQMAVLAEKLASSSASVLFRCENDLGAQPL